MTELGCNVFIARRIINNYTIKTMTSHQNARHATSGAPSFYRWDGDVLIVNILGKPSARMDAIGKPYGSELKVSVTATPALGKATDHMVRFLAREFGVSVSAIEVVFGQTSIHKQLRIQSPTKLPNVFQAITQ